MSWVDRPREEANLFNPPFMAVVIAKVAQGYHRESGRGVPIPVAMLGATLALSPGFRAARPNTLRTSMIAWLTSNSEQRLGLGERAASLADPLREGILFGTAHGALDVTAAAELLPGSLNQGRSAPRDLGQEVPAILSAAEFLGRWFAAAGPPANVLVLWGLSP